MSTPPIQESSPSVTSWNNDVGIDTNITSTTTTTTHEGGSNMNQYNNNIVEELVKLISLSPSKDNIIRLGSTLSTTVSQIIISLSSSSQQQQQSTTTSSTATAQIAENDSHTIKIVYLRAIAQQFQYFNIHTSSNNTTSSTATVASRSTQNVQQYQQQQSSISNTIIDQRVAESIRMILSVINLCLLNNDSSNNDNNNTNLSDMSNTGIVQSLWYLIEYIGTNTISFVICEYLHICILLKQYNFVYPQIIHTWPIPTINSTDSIGTNLLLSNNNNQSFKLPSIDLILRYYYLRGIICMGCCQQQHNDHAIRCFWTCLSVPSIDDCNTISAISIAAWKKLILLQSLSPIGILHTTINDINSLSTYTSSKSSNYNTDFHDTASVMMSSPSSSNPSSSVQSMNTIPSAIGGGGGSPKSINPFATPIGMSFELVRFIKEAKLPSSHNTNNTMSDTSMPQDDSDMHIVPVESTITNSMDNTTSLAASKQSMSSTRYYPNLGVSIYKELINAFITIDRIKFNTIYNECQDLFHKDGNYGYICRLYNALYYRQIYVISRIYATISLNDLSIEMNLSIVQLQSLLEKMKSKLSWSIQVISKENNIFVIFPSELPHPNLDLYYITPIQEQLMEVSNTVQQLNTMIESSKKYTDAIAYEKQNNSNQFTMI